MSAENFSTMTTSKDLISHYKIILFAYRGDIESLRKTLGEGSPPDENTDWFLAKIHCQAILNIEKDVSKDHPEIALLLSEYRSRIPESVWKMVSGTE